MHKTLNTQLQQHIDDLRRHGSQPPTAGTSKDAASSEQRLQRIEAAVSRSEEPRSDTLLQLLHSASEGQTAARAAADAAEAELRSVRGALRAAEGQVALASKRAEDLSLQLQVEQRKSRDLREQSRCAYTLHFRLGVFGLFRNPCGMSSGSGSRTASSYESQHEQLITHHCCDFESVLVTHWLVRWKLDLQALSKD